MFKLQTFLRKPPKLVELEYGLIVPEYENFYIDINDTENIRILVDHGGLDPRYSPMKIIIRYYGTYIVDYNKPAAAGGGLWLDYLQCVEQFIEKQKARTNFGIDYFSMGMESVGYGEVKFNVYLDHNNEEVISIILPKKEFILALLKELKEIWNIFGYHGAFSSSASKIEWNEIPNRVERCESHFK
ncbi:hypothetical protein KZ483_17095 [Paenibacillus sp. sptzw28]|uniref:hypothetical protein n=1 Tax=Paenibacillus sp. sptzw28 TaxID=715179 RepID=UPI001C6E8311|nr:hypothetical protein [Paenibacillus sp. sptzw28]QYR19611.1 hypothetical protein KZ483_17095 [Paenibacillus sp. sptzw28]